MLGYHLVSAQQTRDAAFMLAHGLRRWLNMKPALPQRLVFAGSWFHVTSLTSRLSVDVTVNSGPSSVFLQLARVAKQTWQMVFIQ